MEQKKIQIFGPFLFLKHKEHFLLPACDRAEDPSREDSALAAPPRMDLLLGVAGVEGDWTENRNSILLIFLNNIQFKGII